jgi:superfamily II DNA or RNA helicase
MVELWPHQVEAVAAVREGWSRGLRRPAVVLPTGSGKTTVFGEVAGIMSEFGVTSLILAHRDELIEQAAERVRRMLPGLRVGIVKGPREEIRGRQVIVGSVGTVGRKGPGGEARRARIARAMGRGRLVIVDEAHHAVADSYMRILRDLGAYEPIPADGSLSGAWALGVTATMTRSDRLALGQVWEEVVYRKSIVDMIRGGFLVNAIGVRVKVAGLDLTRVRRVAGDFNQGELSEALHDSLAPKAIARAYVEHAAPRKAIVFCPGVAIGYEVAEAFRSEGVAAIAFDGTTDTIERRRILAAFRSGEYAVVVNCGVLTEGFDEPTIECVIIARPTSSAGLYVQMAGRGLRVIEGCICHRRLGPEVVCPSWRGHKTDCMIMDVIGVTSKHRLAGLVDLGGAERTEELDDDLKIYDQMVEDDEPIDLLGLLDPSPAERAARAGVDGPLVAETVDLFYESRMSWLQTHRGVWFLEGGHDRIVFIAPEATAGRYALCFTGLRSPSGGYLQRGLSLDEARRNGEHEATEETGAGWRTRRSAGWRRGEPSKTQIGEAVRLGIPVWERTEVDGWATDSVAFSRGQLSDAIAIEKVSRRVDDMAVVAGVHRDGYWPGNTETVIEATHWPLNPAGAR